MSQKIRIEYEAAYIASLEEFSSWVYFQKDEHCLRALHAGYWDTREEATTKAYKLAKYLYDVAALLGHEATIVGKGKGKSQ